jgi:hypothetical protein
MSALFGPRSAFAAGAGLPPAALAARPPNWLPTLPQI